MRRPLSQYPPVSRLLRLVALSVALVLVAAPAIFADPRALDSAARLAIFVVLAASCDLMLGHARLVSFAHAMFFGMGAYGVALVTTHFGTSREALLAGALAGAGAAALVAALIAIASLRTRAVAFAMVTLVVASAAAALVAQFPQISGGPEGLAVGIPHELTGAADYGRFPDVVWPAAGMAATEGAIGGQRISGETLRYYLVLLTAIAAFLVMLRLVNSSLGRAIREIRESEGEPMASGRGVLRTRMAVTVLSAVFAAIAGALQALWVGNVRPDAVLSLEVMLTILLMVVIGGMGTIWGAVFGACVVVLAQVHLPGVMAQAATATADLPLIPQLLAPEREPLWLGMALVLSVWMVPRGVAGRFRRAH